MKRCLALVVFCTLSIPAFSINHLYDSGNDFLSECSALDKEASLTRSEMFKNVQCISYTRGLITALPRDARINFESKIKLPLPPFQFCLPDDAKDLQVGRVVLKYIRDNLENAHVATSALVFAALRKAFPCSRK